MREIKCKAFRNDSGELGEVLFIDLENGRAKIEFYTKQNEFYHSICELEDENIVIRWYTGLKDKNGTEIYEGDKLHKEGYWDIQVEFENGSFFVRNTDKVQYANKITNVPINYFGIEQYEVIGNIYEEELLEGRE